MAEQYAPGTVTMSRYGHVFMTEQGWRFDDGTGTRDTKPADLRPYLQIQKGRYYGDAKVVRATQTKPAQLAPNCILVKIKVRVPAAAFDPFEPSAEVVIPADLIQHEVTVEAGDPA